MATISKASVISIITYGDDVREYILKPEKYNYFDAGTFLQLSLETPQNNRWPESRNFSIASFMNDEGTIRLVIRKMGVYTSRIFNELVVGGTCYIKYSFGDFLLPFSDNSNPIVCIAGGTGVAPFLSFIEFLHAEGKIDRLKLFYSTKNKKELICPELLNKLVNPENLNIYLTRENDKNVRCGRIDFEHIVESIDNIVNSHFYICGGEEFTTKFKDLLLAKGAKNIYTDVW